MECERSSSVGNSDQFEIWQKHYREDPFLLNMLSRDLYLEKLQRKEFYQQSKEHPT
jgi:hypothetical protein